MMTGDGARMIQILMPNCLTERTCTRARFRKYMNLLMLANYLTAMT
jgi:hypothetical protein